MIVVCGLMGSGKSTWAAQHYDTVLEYEMFGCKQGQIDRARDMIESNVSFAYVTCYPTTEEAEFFRQYPPEKYVLIDTEIERARKNIIKRGRKSDGDIIRTRFEKNKKLSDLIYRSKIPFERIRLFETSERW